MKTQSRFDMTFNVGWIFAAVSIGALVVNLCYTESATNGRMADAGYGRALIEAEVGERFIDAMGYKDDEINRLMDRVEELEAELALQKSASVESTTAKLP